MVLLPDLIKHLASDHQRMLRWFATNAGTSCLSVDGDANRSRIGAISTRVFHGDAYKYPINVRLEQIFKRQNGFWFGKFLKPSETWKISELLESLLKDQVPVGVITSSSHHGPFFIRGIALITEIRDGHYWMESFGSSGALYCKPERTDAELKRNATLFTAGDQRRLTTVKLAERPKQADFRKMLLDAYEAKCAVSSTDVVAVLEAAHIIPYLGDHTNIVENGILLRSDLHTLFDLGLLSIQPGSYKVRFSSELLGTSYGIFSGRRISLPLNSKDWPSNKALQERLRLNVKTGQ